MSGHALVPSISNESDSVSGPSSSRSAARIQRNAPTPLSFHSLAHPSDDASHREAELFYLQKQIQSQTQMVIVLEDGEHIEGCIEWYDRNTLKVRGKNKTLIYKSAIKYMYKQGDSGH